MSSTFTSLFIDGEWRPASTGETFQIYNPTSGKVVGTAASASPADCAAAIDAAARAFPSWERTPFNMRRDIFLRAAEILGTDRYKKKIRTAAQEEVAGTEDMFPSGYYGQIGRLRNYAGMTTQLKGDTFPSVVAGGQVVAQRRAFGVVFAMAPWNAPTGLTVRALGIPIICGNTVLFKCSEESPRTQAIIIELLEEAGLPQGVLNFIATSKQDTPARTAEIIAHPMVRKINFTGSDHVGKIIAMEAAKCLKPCVLELGGKAPVVVLNDADVPRAARAITSSALLNSGQVCMSTERVIVQRGAASALIHELMAYFKQIRAGDTQAEPQVLLDALLTETAATNILSLIREAVADGAELLLGDLSRQGAIVQPHILIDVRPGMRLWDRESFGPVVALAVVDTVDEAVNMANASEYSMSAGLWTKDVYAALDVAARIRACCTNVNGPTVHSEIMRSLGGLGGASGYGHFTIDDWTQVRMTVLHPFEEPPYPVTERIGGASHKVNGASPRNVNGTSH